jgi:alpha-tubulin suppressor-like RCC1 family protein
VLDNNKAKLILNGVNPGVIKTFDLRLQLKPDAHINDQIVNHDYVAMDKSGIKSPAAPDLTTIVIPDTLKVELAKHGPSNGIVIEGTILEYTFVLTNSDAIDHTVKISDPKPPQTALALNQNIDYHWDETSNPANYELSNIVVPHNSTIFVPLRLIFNQKAGDTILNKNYSITDENNNLKTVEAIVSTLVIDNPNIPHPGVGGSGWRIVSSGIGLTIAIKSDGTLWSWGINGHGALGRNLPNDELIQNTPVQVGTENDWVKISAGDVNACAIKSDGSLWCWGWNEHSQLGDGTNVDKRLPTRIGQESVWRDISIGSNRTCGIKNDGSLWEWGELGFESNPALIHHEIPTQVGNDVDWVKVNVGQFCTMAMKANGSLWAWGDNKFGIYGNGYFNNNSLIPIQIGLDHDWQDFSIRGYHTIAIKQNGTIWSWGANTNGELGNGSSGNSTNLNIPSQIGIEADWLGIGAGWFHSLALKKNFTIYAWGANNFGGLGTNDNINRTTPTIISVVDQIGSVNAGLYNSAIITKITDLLMTGINVSGQLGIGNNLSVPVFTQVH